MERRYFGKTPKNVTEVFSSDLSHTLSLASNEGPIRKSGRLEDESNRNANEILTPFLKIVISWKLHSNKMQEATMQPIP